MTTLHVFTLRDYLEFCSEEADAFTTYVNTDDSGRMSILFDMGVTMGTTIGDFTVAEYLCTYGSSNVLSRLIDKIEDDDRCTNTQDLKTILSTNSRLSDEQKETICGIIDGCSVPLPDVKMAPDARD